MQTKKQALIRIARSILSRITDRVDNYSELSFSSHGAFGLPSSLFGGGFLFTNGRLKLKAEDVFNFTYQIQKTALPNGPVNVNMAITKAQWEKKR